MSTNTPPLDALNDPEFHRQNQALKDVTATLNASLAPLSGSGLDAPVKMTPSGKHLVVDGRDSQHKDGNFDGEGVYPPFVVFDVGAQEYIAGPFDDRNSAEDHRLAILRGEPAQLDRDALMTYWGDPVVIIGEPGEKGEPIGVKVFAGYLNYEGIRIQVDFEAPKDASVMELDAAFLAKLAQQAEVNYVELGEDVGNQSSVAQPGSSDLVAQLTHERDVLMGAIANLAIKTGVTRPDAAVTGPGALVLCDVMAKAFAEAQEKANLYQFVRDSYADQASDDEAAFAALARTTGAEFDGMVLGAMVEARVKGLDKLTKGAGVGFTFSQLAKTAIAATGGRVEAVDWPAVQEATIQAAMVKNGQDRGDVYNTLCEHSPAAITVERQVALSRRIAEVAASLSQPQVRPVESSPHP